MPEIRQNPATKEWVIIATERAKRPEDFITAETVKEQVPDYDENCPFCPGHEESTPPEIMSYRQNGNWSLRVVPNKFPALIPEGESVREKEFDLFRRMDGLGQHEVIIETPLHNASFGQISDEKALEIVTQLRGHAGKRQVQDAERGIAQSWRGIPSGSGAVAIFERG